MTAAVVFPQGNVEGTAAITAGTTQTQVGATLLTGLQNIVTTGNANDGVRLPAAGCGTVIAIVNSSNANLKVYPPSGGTLDGGSADAAVVLTASKHALVVYHSRLDATTIQAA